MRVRNAILTALLAAAGVAVFADDAQAIGRRKKKAAPACGGCPAPVAVAPAAPCCGGGGAINIVGTTTDPNGNVIVSGQGIPNPMPGGVTTTTIPGTNVIPVTNVQGGTITNSGTVIPATYVGGYQGGVIPAGAYYGNNAGNQGLMYGGYPYGSQTFNSGFQSGVVNSALGIPTSYGPSTTVRGAVGNYAGNAVGRGLFRRR